MEPNADIPIYVQIISGTILGWALGTLMTGLVRFIQHPKDNKINGLHVLWIIFLLLSIFIFWWQEALAYSQVTWTFHLYLYQIVYCSTYLLMASMLLPETVEEYGSHYNYLIERRAWFYGSVILALLLDIGNVTIKMGWNEVIGDPIYMGSGLLACAILVVGMFTRRAWVHYVIALFFVGVTVLTILP